MASRFRNTQGGINRAYIFEYPLAFGQGSRRFLNLVKVSLALRLAPLCMGMADNALQISRCAFCENIVFLHILARSQNIRANLCDAARINLPMFSLADALFKQFLEA